MITPTILPFINAKGIFIGHPSIGDNEAADHLRGINTLYHSSIEIH